MSRSMTRRTLLASVVGLQAATPDWQSLLARSITHDEDNLSLLRHYVFEIYDRSMPPGQRRETQSFEVNLVGPGMYFRKLTHNDKPISPQEATKEQTRLRAHLSQTPASDAQAPWRKEREILKTYLATHQFRFKGEKTIDKRPVFVITSKPPAKSPPSLAYLTSAECRLSIDRETGHWVEAVCNIQDSTSFALTQLLIGRLSLPYSSGLINRGDISADSTLTLRLQRLEDGLWVPRISRIKGPGILSELSFSKFRKFTSESQLLTDSQ